MKHCDDKIYDTISSLHISIAKGLKKSIIFQNYNFTETIGVPQVIVCGHPCLLTFMIRNIQCGLVMYKYRSIKHDKTICSY